MLRADQAKITWNQDKKRWEVRIQVGAEVVKRPLSGNDLEALKSQAVEVAKDEGYELDLGHVLVEQSPSKAA